MTLFEDIDTLVSKGESVATITIVEKSGSAPREVGAMMVVSRNEEYGTIGGGTVEALAIEDAREVLRGRGDPGLRSYELSPGGNTGMVCGGEMDVFINLNGGQKRLYIAGGGHIAISLVEMGRELEYEITVVDDREEYTTDERFGETNAIQGDYEDTLNELPMTERTAVVVATRSGTFDRKAVRAALDGGAGYIGLVASETKAGRVLDGLREEGKPERDLVSVKAPAGIDLGGDGPEDVALSILAEMHRDFFDASGHRMTRLNLDELTVVRGGGDNVSGVIYRLHEAGYPVIVSELGEPTVQRLEVTFATAMFDGEVTVEGVTARKADTLGEAISVLRENEIAVIEDPEGNAADEFDATIQVDGIMPKGKYDTGTRRGDADIVIGLGPGFEAGEDVDAVVETNRGPDLGCIYYEGTTSEYDGVPSEFEGYTTERVFRAPTAGRWETASAIGDLVEKGDRLGTVNGVEVTADMHGLVRGLAYDGLDVKEDQKLGDLDPREEIDPTKISDKALCLGGSVLTAIQKLQRPKY